MDDFLGLNYIAMSEKAVKRYTKSYLKGIDENVPNTIDLIFKLSYFIGETADPESDIGATQSICRIQYLQSPYSLWSIFKLYEEGYYLEAQVLYRHVLEAFIQSRYFHKHPSKLIDHIKGTKRVNFSVMFNEFSPGYYKLYYKKFISEAVHGLAIKDIYRVDRKNSRTILGLEFSEDLASTIINQLVPLLYGFLNGFPVFFPQNNLIENPAINKAFVDSKNWLEYAIDSHTKSNPHSVIWINHMKELITFS